MWIFSLDLEYMVLENKEAYSDSRYMQKCETISLSVTLYKKQVRIGHRT